MHRSPYFGRSLEFREHRQYAHGDDLRHVDWKVWARQDRYYVKQYEEDTNLRGTLLVDRSESMAYGAASMTKYEYAATAASVIAYVLLRQNDAVGCQVFNDTVSAEAPARSSRGHLGAIADLLRGEPFGKKTDLGAVLTNAAVSLPRRGVVVLISDLFGDLARLREGLSQLRERGHDLIVLHVLDDDELDFRFEGPTRFAGLESTVELSCNPRALREDYLNAMKRFLADARGACLSQAADYSLIRTSEPFDAVLTQLLSRRMQTR
ncbi:MAG: DUF58 domain-containing protein [Planctomycetota bacterium]